MSAEGPGEGVLPVPDEAYAPAMAVQIGLARRLHDGVLQRLTSVAAALGSGAPLSAADRGRCLSELEAAITGLASAIGEALDETVVDHPPRSVAATVREAYAYCDDARAELRCEGDADLAPELTRLVRDFVVEAMRNAGNHACPTTIALSVQALKTSVRVDVHNDGVAARGASGGTHLGLRLLDADAAQFSGTIDARPVGPDEWRTTLTLPLETPRARRFARDRER